jgi:chemotaxis protein methyltransferase CheR
MAISSTEFDFIRELVRRRAAIVLELGKEYLVEARLEPLARRKKMKSIHELVSRLRTETSGALHARVVEAMTTNETSFFRDYHPWEALREVLLPQLIERRQLERRLTIWCAASSTGQEPYSVAMLLQDFGAALEGWNLQILATDISSAVIARGREGRYNQLEINRGLPVRYLERDFQQVGKEWQVKDELRRLVEFRLLNLAEPWPLLPPVDVLMLRNVMIYFDIETKKEMLARAGKILRRDGYLILGGAETTNYLDESFERVRIDRAACYRLRT